MLVAIYARSANEDDIIMQVENCRRYILENWNLTTQINKTIYRNCGRPTKPCELFGITKATQRSQLP